MTGRFAKARLEHLGPCSVQMDRFRSAPPARNNRVVALSTRSGLLRPYTEWSRLTTQVKRPMRDKSARSTSSLLSTSCSHWCP